MIFKNLRLILLLFLAFSITSCHHKKVYEDMGTLYKVGDQQEWAAINFNDQNWEDRLDLKGGEVFWSRTKIMIKESPQEFQCYGVYFFNASGEYEVYWDGVPIGRNGNPGKEKAIGPTGSMWRVYKIPFELTTEGEHLLALRKSLYYYPNHIYFHTLIQDYEYLLESPLLYTAFMHITAGAFLIAAIYFFFLFLGNKKEKPTLIFSISCFLFFALIIMEFIRTYVPIHYSQHHIRMEIIAYLTFFISILIPLYFSLQFKYAGLKPIFIIYLVFLLYIFYREHGSFDYTSKMMAITSWCFSFGIVIWGVYNKYKGAITILITMIICAIIFKLTYFDTSLFAGFSAILLGMFYILSVKAKEQRLAYENSLVQSTRLRLELLKKNIQPHFLMNSLTSLIDWVEESPKKGVFFIEALAREFDLFNQIESKTIIPVGLELELCRTHLEIMKYRKEINYVWEEEGINEKEQIPPATIHTLLENGITHCAPLSDNTIKFKLVFEEKGSHKSYTFLTFGKLRNTSKETKGGTGLKYVKARLEESYGSNWSFSSRSTSDGWENIINIYN
ncbi:histidine kinase [Xanthovirga aplysinae]|uniref:histidine kinase n=1 Tax=Xanthovirga aplysinae TaxID=2529853 RepID=UPI0012BD65CA|nr:histidine kinase [Xanthovirga aplysinae]MTI32678.1 regulator [Xanthovirga aplysinae]